jgi:hypothetical protein
MLKITRAESGAAVFKVSGRMEAEDIPEVRTLISSEPQRRRIVLNLEDLILVDQDAVSFLESCEAEDIKLENCPTYIREWIDSKGGVTNSQKH